MAEEKNWRAKSRLDWITNPGSSATTITEQVTIGSLQRIADATELMAGNYTKMQRDLDYYMKREVALLEQNRKLRGQLSAQKGLVTKAKNRTK